MRSMVWLTVIGSIILTAPTLLWLAGIAPAAIIVLHLTAFALTVRLLLLTSVMSQRRLDVSLVGAFSGLIGSLMSQILLHTATASASLAVAFSGYGQLGAHLYQWEVLSPWWPYVVVAWSGLAYATVGWLASFAARRTLERVRQV